MVLNEILATQQIGFPILSVLIWLPVAALALIAVTGNEKTAYRIALMASIAELLLAVVVIADFKLGTADLQFVERAGFYRLGIDGISVLFLPLTALLTLLITFAAEATVKNNTRGYLMAVLGFEAAMMGAFAASDVMLFWFFFAIEILPSYFLIARYGTGEKREAAANHYLLMMLVSAAILLFGAIKLSAAAGGATDIAGLLAAKIPVEAQTTIFLLLCIALGIKAPLFPFHTWMPKVLEQGPVVGMSIFLVGVKVGTYAFMRFVIPVLPEASREWFWLLAGMGAVGMVYGAMIALIQTNLRRLLAFASLSHMGVVMLGLFSLNYQGFQGGLLQMINLGITGAGLFFIAGFLYTRMGPPEVSGMGGLAQRMPLLALAFIVIGLAGVGMPGTNGFNGEHLAIMGAYRMHWTMALAIGIGTILGAAYFLWYYQRAFFGSASAAAQSPMPDLNRREGLIAVSMAGLIFWIGLYTGPFLNIMDGSLKAMASRVAPQIQTAKHLSNAGIELPVKR